MSDSMPTLGPGMEPYRIRVVEPIRRSTLAEREEALRRARYNLYALDASEVMIDLLTDSGTCAISSSQSAAMMRGDESYAGSASYRRMELTIRQLFGFSEILPTHQGRAAERLLLGALAGAGSLIPSNTLFDTTRANCLDLGVEPCDLPADEFWDFESSFPFKGNIDTEALEAVLAGPESHRIPLVLMTITNNICADLPVSMANLRRTSELCQQYGKPLYLDACRFAQNAWYIREFEAGYREKSIRQIVAEIFALAEGCIVSAKKDCMAQMGGFLALRSPKVAEAARSRMLLTEGFVTYGGMTGRDMESIATGLEEGIDEAHLSCRMESTRYLHDRLKALGVPMLSPSGGHAVYLPANRILPHVTEHPGHALAVELYRASGIRSTKIAMEPTTGPLKGEHLEFLRLALPNRVYTRGHLDFVAESMAWVMRHADAIMGMRILSSPLLLGGFMAEYEPVCTLTESIAS